MYHKHPEPKSHSHIARSPTPSALMRRVRLLALGSVAASASVTSSVTSSRLQRLSMNSRREYSARHEGVEHLPPGEQTQQTQVSQAAVEPHWNARLMWWAADMPHSKPRNHQLMRHQHELLAMRITWKSAISGEQLSCAMVADCHVMLTHAASRLKP